jgi:hypothetical protein
VASSEAPPEGAQVHILCANRQKGEKAFEATLNSQPPSEFPPGRLENAMLKEDGINPLLQFGPPPHKGKALRGRRHRRHPRSTTRMPQGGKSRAKRFPLISTRITGGLELRGLVRSSPRGKVPGTL